MHRFTLVAGMWFIIQPLLLLFNIHKEKIALYPKIIRVHNEMLAAIKVHSYRKLESCDLYSVCTCKEVLAKVLCSFYLNLTPNVNPLTK